MTDKGEEESKAASFGHDALCSQLVNRLDTQFKTPKREIEPSLVIGLFGEWGSGKSHLLNLINEHYQQSEDIEKITIPITFNPWRFEKEDHLIIPLMKTTELALKDYKKKVEKQEWFKRSVKNLGTDIEKIVEKTSRLCAFSTLAFISSLKTKVSVPGLFSAEINGKDLADAAKEIDKSFKEVDKSFAEDAEDSAILDDLNSIYFNFHQKLKQAIGHDKKEKGSPKINLLFLIDDIDRCLPEKAVEMLESIKLFLDVEGCAFVLAVDDEVVERGIIHRYRDYIFQQQDNNDAQLNTAPPITGSEYLEKIIHLPFRLPLPTEKEIRAFLLQNFKDVFNSEEYEKIQKHEDHESNEGNDKKLVRQLIGKDKEKAALLELFVEAVPRVPRKLIRSVELFQLQKEILKERGCHTIDELTLARLVILQLLVPDIYRFGRQRQGFLGIMEYWENHKTLGKGKWLLASTKNEDFFEADTDQRLFEINGQPLLELIRNISLSRSSFNIRNIINLEYPSAKSLKTYFSSVDETDTADSITKISTGMTAQAELQVDDRPRIRLDDENEFIALISSDRSDAWTTVAGLPGINSGIMSNDLFKQFKEAINAPISLESAYLQPQWLGLVQSMMSKQNTVQIWGEADKGIVEELVKHLRKENESDAKKRLHYGDCLAILGDPRKGVGVKNGLPEIEWQRVAQGEFQYGDKKEENKKKMYLNAFGISRYPITNQQFQCFLDAKDVEDASWWEDMPDNQFNNLKSSNWTQANRPKVTVSWYQAVAFTRWLSNKTGQKIRLPTEFEWEKAARGSDERKYPWGNEEPDSNKLNYNNDLAETSTVGLYTQGKSPCGAYDMSGNVWEWCLNKYEKPDDINVDNKGDSRVLRGGSFDLTADLVQCAFRVRYHPIIRDNLVGFRVVRM